MSWPVHGGNRAWAAAVAGKRPGEILDFSANLNPCGPPEWLRGLISARVSELTHYPDPEACELIAAAAAHYQIPADELIAGNGTEEILYALPRAFPFGHALVLAPGYADYARAAQAAGWKITEVPLTPENDFWVTDALVRPHLCAGQMVFLGHPHNPTGLPLEADVVRAWCADFPDTFFIVDEAFADFVPGLDRFVERRPANLLVLLSLTKNFALAGLRLGLAAGSPGAITALRGQIPPWSVNTLAQAAGIEALRDADFLHRSRTMVAGWRQSLSAALAELPGVRVFPGQANFLLLRFEGIEGIEGIKDAGTELGRRLLAEGIAVRFCENFSGLGGDYLRLAVRSEEENARLVAALETHWLAMRAGEGDPAALKKSGKMPARRRPSIMFQGTSSNAGKSVLTAALCRILRQDGLRVAPFKSQNMSLNSFVTREGGEMGRAQVVQAQACRIEPDVRMNPILLKPSSHTGSQVIVLGRPVAQMEVREFFNYKATAFERAREAYDSLAEEYDAIVLEGAGSPGEVNLKSHDIVNMAMARHARAPVLLVGDIDRGGVYASFIGTMEVLAEWERALVAGFVVNRFRGQESLLASAHEIVQRHSGVPVLGVVPYLADLGLPEEDSVSFKESFRGGAAGSLEGQVLDAVLIDLPHVSNFTDFDAFHQEPDVRLRVVRHPSDLGQPEVVFLPGSKNVPGDVAKLRETGMVQALQALAAAGRTEIVGVCAGLQMLGRRIEDPDGVESATGGVDGMGLLPLTTVLAPEKTLRLVEARHEPSGLEVRGYEIHHGRTTIGAGFSQTVRRADGELIGGGNEKVWGSYLHGIFDDDAFRRWFLDRLRQRRGWAPIGRVVAPYSIEPALDRLAGVVRERLDMVRVYQLLGL